MPDLPLSKPSYQEIAIHIKPTYKMKKVFSKPKIVLSGNTAGIEKTAVEKKSVKIAVKKNQLLSTPIKNSSPIHTKYKKILGPVFDILDTAVCVINGQGYFVDANKTYCTLFGYVKEELIGNNIVMIVPAKYSTGVQQMSDVFTATAEGSPAEHTGLHKDGSLLHLTATSALLAHTDGKQYTVISIQKIAPTKIEDTGLFQGENKYRSVIEQSLTAFFLTLPNGQILDANEAAVKMFGYSLPQFKQAGWHAIFDDADLRYSYFLKKGEREGTVKDILTGIRKKGEHFFCEVSSESYKDINGETRTSLSIIDISETLKVHKENLLLLDNTEESFVLVDKDLKIISFNKQFQQSYKRALLIDVIAGNSILDYTLPGRTDTLKAIYKKVFSGEKVCSEIEITVLNGNVLTIENHFKPITDDKGNIIAAFVSSLDITEKKYAERQLITNNKRYQALVENGHDVIIILSPEAKALYISASISNVLGYKETTGVQENFFSLIHPEDEKEFLKLWQKILNHPGLPVQNHVCRLLHANGSWRWIENTVTNMLQDASVEGIVNNFRDISERMEATEKMRQSEENLKAIFENTDEGFVLLDTSGIVKTCNGNGKQNDFMDAEIQIGRHIFEFIEEPRKKIFNTIFLKALKGESIHYERLANNKITNEPMWLSFAVKPVKEAGKIIAVSITGRNITEQKNKDLKIAQTKNLLDRAESITHAGSIDIDFINNKRIWSDEFYRILGLEPGAIEATDESFIQYLHPGDKDDYLNNFLG